MSKSLSISVFAGTALALFAAFNVADRSMTEWPENPDVKGEVSMPALIGAAMASDAVPRASLGLGRPATADELAA